MKRESLFQQIDNFVKKDFKLSQILIAIVIVTVVSILGLLTIRKIFIPSFTSANNDFRYQWHRVANEQEWKDYKIKHKGSEYCAGCHNEHFKNISKSLHSKIQCENCHGAAFDHPDNPTKLTIDKSRDLCLRCHFYLPYRPTDYPIDNSSTIKLKLIKPSEHAPDEKMQCIVCHDPHKTELKIK